MGQISSQFDVKNQIASSGPAGCWTVSAAVLKSSLQDCTLFVFDKKTLDNLNPFGKGSKSEYDWFQSVLITEVKQLSKLRHPSILRVLEPLVELKDTGLAFASEPITSNVSMLSKSMEEIDEVEIQSGLLQLLKGLQFLHENKIAHCCLAPNTIFVDLNGNWKIGGFTFSQTTGSRVFLDIPPAALPHLCFLAPELLSDQPVTGAADVFSLGSLIHSMYNQGSPVTSTSGTQMYLEEVRRGLKVTNLPISLQGLVQQMLSFDPEFRPGVQSIMDCEFFNNNLIGTIKLLDRFLELSVVDKARFLKDLPTRLQQFSVRTSMKKILPTLLSELKNAEIAPFLLPSIFWISDRITDAEFYSIVIPIFKNTVFILKDPPQANLLVLSRVDLFVKKLSDAQFQDHVMSFILETLSSTDEKIILRGTKAISRVTSHLDYISLKVKILPKLLSLFRTCKSVAIQGNILMAISSFVSKLDQQSCVDNLLPFLSQISQPPSLLLLIIAKLYKEISLMLDAIQISATILPSLWYLSSKCTTTEEFNHINIYIEDLTISVRKNRKGLVKRTSAEELRSISAQKPITPHNSNPLIPLRPISINSTPVIQDNLISTLPPRPNSSLLNNPVNRSQPSLNTTLRLTKEDLSKFES